MKSARSARQPRARTLTIPVAGQHALDQTRALEGRRKAQMWLVRWIVMIVVVLFAVLLLGGLLLPSTFTVTRSAVIAAPPEKVYALVADPRGWQLWSPWSRRDPLIHVQYSGPTSGAGATWRWQSKSQGDGAMTFTAAEPGRRVAYELYFGDVETTSTGELRFEPQEAVTRVTWTMNGDTGKNPFSHWMALAAGGMVGKDFSEGLAGLRATAEKP
jgi:uncharacterized protein YndB with AHSA1/START domain